MANHYEKHEPLAAEKLIIRDQMERKKKVKPLTKVPKLEAIDHMNDSDDMNLMSRILENLEDIDPEEEQMFMNLNIRNRRQKILHNLSFETRIFDVYDPVYTSEEYNSEDNSSSMTSSSSGSCTIEGSVSQETFSSYDSQENSQSSGPYHNTSRQGSPNAHT